MSEERLENIIQETDSQIERPEDWTDPDVLYEEMLRTIRKYWPDGDFELLHRAYMTAKNAHMDQRRKSGEPYIIHPLCVGIILADLGMDIDTIIAGLLHDVVEDTILVDSQVRRIFGDDVANLVDGVTKLTNLQWKEDKVEEQAANLRKMFLAMAKDIRVILIKLADRLHNMRTMQYMRPDKQIAKSRETLEIYSPIAQRLGISKIKVELDDLALKYIEPDVYNDLFNKIALKKDSREAFIDGIIKEVKSCMEGAGIECEVSGRVKHFFSIYKKMVNQNKTIDQIYDLFAVRIIVDTVKDCYAALGIIHENYKPIPGRFKDYVAMPKQNMYQSLHTTVVGKNGQPFEIQIRTVEMHRTAEFGIAAHWQYKEAGASVRAVQDDTTSKMNWLSQIIEWQSDLSDNTEFLNAIKSDLDLFSDSVYCFTPTGDVKTLPAGSTPIDFAYSIHSAVGNRMVGARANGQLVNIDYIIKNGDRIEIITSQNSRGPSRDWLKIVKSSQARNKINQWFKAELKEDNIARGKELIDKYCRTKGINYIEINRPEIQEKVLHRYAIREWDALLASIGHGGLKEGQIVNRMVEEHNLILKKNMTDEQVLESVIGNTSDADKIRASRRDGGITVKGIHDLAVRFSRCCSPLPGDEICGYVTRGRGVSIHRTDCVNIISMSDEERARLVPAEWDIPEGRTGEKYLTELRIFALNRIGMIVDISRVFTEKNIDILSINTNLAKDGNSTVNISFDIGSKDELTSITDRLRQVPGVRDVERATGG